MAHFSAIMLFLRIVRQLFCRSGNHDFATLRLFFAGDREELYDLSFYCHTVTVANFCKLFALNVWAR